ncbi:ABC transporter substrate-binding protein [Caldimonas tepidiphila]|uniref:ABC transporter substrate-binding protein n=1 Tax=Caldimonas tepidiphila TaxID=2315841 RepID=UPI000E5ADB38|nr:ABC transporter substrate-binding protein [Caldimonas tepidiphila]
MRRLFRLFALGASLSLAAGDGPAQAQIRIGQPSGFTGAVATGVQENTQGARLWFDTVNERGGIHGQKIELLTADDKFDPKLTAELGRKLIAEQGVVALFLNRGTPHAEALLPVINEFKVPLVAPSTGAMLLHRPAHPLVFNVRAPYQREAERAVRHLAQIGIQRIALLQTDDSFGADAVQGALRGLEAVGLQPLFLEKFDRARPDFSRIAQRVMQEQAQAVMFIGAAASVASGTQVLRQAGSRAQVVTLSNNASGGFIRLMGEHARGTIVTQVFPYERSMASPLVKEAADLARTRGIAELTPAMLEGYTAAKVLTEGLRRAGPGVTPARLVQALEGLRRYDLGGLELSFGPGDRSGVEFADLSVIGPDGRFQR